MVQDESTSSSRVLNFSVMQQNWREKEAAVRLFLRAPTTQIWREKGNWRVQRALITTQSSARSENSTLLVSGGICKYGIKAAARRGECV